MVALTAGRSHSFHSRFSASSERYTQTRIGAGERRMRKSLFEASFSWILWYCAMATLANGRSWFADVLSVSGRVSDTVDMSAKANFLDFDIT